ncbi:Uncharacterised protein [Legionella pneumophila]|uniref:hypothetical protein n=1 Tax=Legionella pneumophila TaxID=446 RepID=UPI0007709C17|nr:hypothetical protein [Legionella pneumophila]CZG54705.1 Uncharacterised protein [Legionella pneumophila]
MVFPKCSNVDKDQLTPLTNYTKQQQKQLMGEAIKGSLKFYIFDINGNPVEIEPSDVARIQTKHPVLVKLNFQSRFNEFINYEGAEFEEYGQQSLWVEKIAADILLNLPLCQCVKPLFTTKLLEAQNKAIKKFWLNYDPKYLPKSEEIINYLVNECGVALRMAQGIDGIIRPDHLKKGGNKRKTTKGVAL